MQSQDPAFTCTSNQDSNNEEENDPESQRRQIRVQLEQVSSQNRVLLELISKYVDQLDEQVLHKDVLENDLDHHKQTLIETMRELAEKNCVIEAQEYLLFSAREEVQDLVNANAKKDLTISHLRSQVAHGGIANMDYEGTKKRKLL